MFLLFSCQVVIQLCDPWLQSVYAIYDLFVKCALSMPITNSYRKVHKKSERLKAWFFYAIERYPIRPAIYSILGYLCSPKTQREKMQSQNTHNTYTWILPSTSSVTSGKVLSCPKSQFSGPYNGMIILICCSTQGNCIWKCCKIWLLKFLLAAH